MNIFNSTQKGITGFEYEHLKDNIKWNGLKPKEYVNLLNSMLNKFIEKIPSKK